ncbi:MAG: ABC transporter ATP-binding protein [Puniceicoccales bacterium]|jgi:iron(III) transport system ATP-binding protein|nr:ABC transporter ATP-binding protein [Puniceicoccales bacterium]
MVGIGVEHVSKCFGTAMALQDIHLSVQGGELFFLLGPSGCGKTTLLRILAGFCAPDAGQLFFGSRDVTRLPAHLRQTGMVFQSYALWPHMTVADNVAFGLRQKKLPRSVIQERLEETLVSVRMEQYAQRKPNELSGGQQQRVALARALAIRPRCLLLDEPLSNLDAQLRNEMRLEIRRLCKAHRLTTVYVTHDQKEALSVADRIAVFSRGRVEQVGTPLKVYKTPKNRFVAQFVGESNFVEGRVLGREGERCTVETALGQLLGTAGDPAIALGDHVYLSLRPEAIRLRGERIDCNCLEGKLVDVTYFGEVAHYDFLRCGIRLKVSELNPRHLQHSSEEIIYANMRPEDVLLLRS